MSGRMIIFAPGSVTKPRTPAPDSGADGPSREAGREHQGLGAKLLIVTPTPTPPTPPTPPAPLESYTRTTRQRRWQLRKRGLNLCQWCGAMPRGARRDGGLYAGCDGCRRKHNARRRQPQPEERDASLLQPTTHIP